MLFALSIIAKIPKVGAYYIHAPYVITARSKEEAEGMGIARAKERWPIEEGYTLYDANAVLIPQGVIDALASEGKEMPMNDSGDVEF